MYVCVCVCACVCVCVHMRGGLFRYSLGESTVQSSSRGNNTFRRGLEQWNEVCCRFCEVREKVTINRWSIPPVYIRTFWVVVMVLVVKLEYWSGPTIADHRGQNPGIHVVYNMTILRIMQLNLQHLYDRLVWTCHRSCPSCHGLYRREKDSWLYFHHQSRLGIAM